MSEYWKSTPKYWCKHCSCYVRDTKIEKANHEATAKHQGALKRSLRDLHRNHEREEREKERARQEIARLNGVVGGSSSAGPSGASTKPSGPSESQLKTQREQLAAMGVAMPTDFRPEMALPGEWTVTKTTVIEETNEADGETKIEAKATGIRKREETEEQKEEEEAMRGLFKKPRRWGRDSKTMPDDEDEDLDALLSSAVPLKAEAAEERGAVKKEEDVEDDDSSEARKPKTEDVSIKAEPDTGAQDQQPSIKREAVVKAEEAEESSGITPVVFKKRKPKGIRSK
ncbi:uncharacterized protein TRIVIDRAFT_55196 [Trichoderma virens Gv29-8]|uniref:U1-type domain-containing protein n=1 Tax=Hypocrea virens (strain Gv29-8 / FGSC 10586) TaxID=413071 RepID=G9MES7_HYPVG|nr:uncharacterized protein TRIVIDRAFT_55196 [Trichoderma virens Gv29-8]EHK26895.1 hypothetical protein TRIVIDRAFT_55196 [Trichoderma virens Gv29-8]UKZ57348.1 hypothetical protein TrVGV298_011201 [Trichoderma virens]